MIECTKYTPHNKGPLQGFADILVPKWGVEIKGCSLFMKDGQRWLNLPSREFVGDDGKKAYAPIIRFVEKAHMEAFCAQAKKAVDNWCQENPHQDSSDSQWSETECGEVPF